MNGIIHTCSRSLTSNGLPYVEGEIFISIFAYIQALFEKIRPKKILFLAVDGVAPKAKVNQQRARRFRSIKEAEMEAAKQKKTLSEDRFDSNCITPGTEFMHRLSEHLKYLIVKKINEDPAWRTIKVIFSGPDVPGEGEHKVMEFIRLSKAQPDYNPNVRHCLYGLDADLILLGLLSHDPHFALLREEVTFGRNQKVKTVDETKFYLLHLCLMREYQEMEFRLLFSENKDFGQFSLENFIDDFILLMCLVGNDFLPNIPGFNLGEDILDLIFCAYKKAWSKMKGHINENGIVKFSRLAILMGELGEFELKSISVQHPSLFIESAKENMKTACDLWRNLLDTFLSDTETQIWSPTKPCISVELDAIRQFSVHFHCRVTSLPGDKKLPTIQKTLDTHGPNYDSELKNFLQTLQDYNRPVEDKIEEACHEWKRSYYLNKLGFDINEEPEKLEELLAYYCEGLQWNMLYYYEGVASWTWYYPYHYAPHISDLSKFMVDFVCDPFDLNQPLKPFEQLMAVLPPASSKLVPKSLSWLMVNESSPIIDYYPKQFETDANGKKAPWEAIVKIPFIEDDRLLPAVRQCYHLLEAFEVKRNQFGITVSFEYSNDSYVFYGPSNDFPDINECNVKLLEYELPVLSPNQKFVATLCKGALVGIQAMPGFPTLATLPIKSILDSGMGLDVFGTTSKGLSMVIAIDEGGEFGRTFSSDIMKIAQNLINSRIFVNWPHLKEARVAYLTNGTHRFEKDENGSVTVIEAPPKDLDNLEKVGESLEREYKKRCAVLIGNVEVLVWANIFTGMIMAADGSTFKQFSDTPIPYALQTIVTKTFSEDSRFEEKKPQGAPSLFPVPSLAIYLGRDKFGAIVDVMGHDGKLIKIKVRQSHENETEFMSKAASDLLNKLSTDFINSRDIVKLAKVSPLFLSKFASSMLLFLNGEIIKGANIGMNIKSDSKGHCALGLARKTSQGWEYSKRVLNLILALKKQFPSVIQNLEAEITNNIIDAGKVFSDPSITKESIKGIIEPFVSFIREFLGERNMVPIEGEYLDKHGIKLICEVKLAEYLRKLQPTKASSDQPLESVPMELLLSPITAVPRLSTFTQQFKIGDRIIYVGSVGSSLPFSSKGTVVGMSKGNLRILLDETTIGCGNLDETCEDGRGIILKPNECLNITNQQPPNAERKSTEPQGRTITVEELFSALNLGPKNGPINVSVPKTLRNNANALDERKVNFSVKKDLSPEKAPTPFAKVTVRPNGPSNNESLPNIRKTNSDAKKGTSPREAPMSFTKISSHTIPSSSTFQDENAREVAPSKIKPVYFSTSSRNPNLSVQRPEIRPHYRDSSSLYIYTRTSSHSQKPNHPEPTIKPNDAVSQSRTSHQGPGQLLKPNLHWSDPKRD